ncbi:MAG: TrbC/VirB2 family protein [Cetobacterium sp.]|uniref:TrbC/VirB2 family protein n=1 Tax=Cetobacterium sp. TaxID=2071632 RepID=UPI003F3367BE
MKKFKGLGTGTALYLINSLISFASTNSDMVWEEPASVIQKSVNGPVALAVALISIAVAGLTWAFSDGGSMMGKSIKIVAALAIVGGASILVSNVFNITGGVTFG